MTVDKCCHRAIMTVDKCCHRAIMTVGKCCPRAIMTVGKSYTQAHALHTEQKTNLLVVLADPI